MPVRGTVHHARDLLRRTSAHLDALAEEVHLIEHAIGEELGRNTGPMATNLARLQRLDFLRQSLEDLALLSLLMSQQNALRVPEDAAEKLRLGSTKSLLENLAHAPASNPTSHEGGEVDLF